MQTNWHESIFNLISFKIVIITFSLLKLICIGTKIDTAVLFSQFIWCELRKIYLRIYLKELVFQKKIL